MPGARKIDAKRAMKLLRYDPDSGKFFWRIRRGGRVAAGDPAGSLQSAPGADPYVCIMIDGKPVRAHRLAWVIVSGADIPHMMDVDHINGVRTDNRAANLRAVTRSQNLENQTKAHANSKSGLLGAHWHSPSGMWHARIKTNKKEISLGYYKDPADAHRAYLEAKRKLHIRIAT